MTPAGKVREFGLPHHPSLGPITKGPDGNLWFGATDEVGRITPAGDVTEFPLTQQGDVMGVADGPDGDVWFTAQWRSEPSMVGWVSPDGSVTEVPTPSGGALGIAGGSDGNVYFAEYSANLIGSVVLNRG